MTDPSISPPAMGMGNRAASSGQLITATGSDDSLLGGFGGRGFTDGADAPSGTSQTQGNGVGAGGGGAGAGNGGSGSDVDSSGGVDGGSNGSVGIAIASPLDPTSLF